MRLRDQVWLSFHNLMLHKVRSILTSLGIIFGVGSVIAMLAISEGAKIQALAQIEAMGTDKIIVATRKPPASGKDVSDSSGQSLMDRYGITTVDLDHIRRMDNVEQVSVARNSRKKILSGTKRLDLSLVGVSIDFLKFSRSEIVQGRWLSRIDGINNNCVIGLNVKRSLFSLGEKDIIGSTIMVEKDIFRIVGILENTHGTNIPGIGSPNDCIFVTIMASDSVFGKKAYDTSSRNPVVEDVDFDTFIVQVHDVSYIDFTSKRIASYMSKVHSETKDWTMLVPLDLLKQQEATQNIFTIVMSSIAGISLLVGGIGIMNIMLANVYERRKEIGTRRALGAQKGDIIKQFLFETIFLTSLGGGTGVALGIFIAKMVTLYANMPTAFSIWFIILALVISAVIGVLFGTYPAWKAAQQNPIEVLRSE